MSANIKYNNKFSFGISLEMSLDEYEKIIQDYLPYLSSVYFSLPYGDEFHTRDKVKEEYSKCNAKEKLAEILNLFKKYNIKLEAVINQYNIELDKIKEALNKLDKIITIDSVCCLDEYYDIINEYYDGNMYMISSFNNIPLHKGNFRSRLSTLEKYDMLVLSKEWMRDIKLLEDIKYNYGFDLKLLINNGCSFNCMSCRAGNNNCKKVFMENLKKYTPEELYAIQSFFPWELKKFFERVNDELITEIKISNRPSTYDYINNCLKSYIFCEKEEKYISKSNKYYHLWGRQANLNPYYDEFDINRINKVKRDLWEISEK